jgi:acyl-CoA hydrolase
MPSISDTVTEMVQWVFPEHAGAPGQIHGGRMMQWIATVGTIAASRVACGNVVLGAMDDIDFLHPVKVGEVAMLRAQVELIGRSSLEVGVRVFSENVHTGARAVTLNSHLVFIKVDEQLHPSRSPRGSSRRAARRRRSTRRRWTGGSIARNV